MAHSSSLLQTGGRTLLALLFLAGSWWAIGDTISLGFMGKPATGTVVGYWDRPPPLARFRDAPPIREPVVQVEGDRPTSDCRTVYRGIRRERQLPARGARVTVRYRAETFQQCVAEVTLFSPLRLGLGIGAALIGIWSALAAADEWAP